MSNKIRYLLVITTLLIVTLVNAQVTTSSMSGKVTTQEEPIIGATVTAIHEPSGSRYGAITNVNGQFNLQAMRTGGPYKVEVSYIGYQSAIYKDIFLSLGENYVLNVSLKESSELLDEIVVTASKSSNMKSDRAGAIMNADREKIATIPTISRSMNDVMRLSPQGSDVGNGFAAGGGNYRQSFVTVDGASFNNTFGIGSNLPANGSPISLDALEQISVSITPYDVRQSGFTGGAINAVTRSGDNEFQGTAYSYINNQNLRGKSVADYELKRSKDQSNVYGVSIGGPIIKDKLFFFINGEYEDNVTAGPSGKPRDNDEQKFLSDDYYRPLKSDMDIMRNYLIQTYNYDPGRYNDYSINTPAYRIMARLDWNINTNNKINLRYSLTNSKDSNSPTSSTSPLYGTTIYPGNNGDVKSGYGRTSRYSMYFENSRYYQERNFSSIASEWNSRLMDGMMNNMLRFSYSSQDEPRSYDGRAFPTVDILKDGAVYTSFGTELFTAGNFRQTSTFNITDEFNLNIGNHKWMAGFQYEHTKAVNGYMQGGNGYYVFSSWADFVGNKKPAAFAIAHGNTADLAPFSAILKFQQFSLYLQDEISLSDNFKLSAGLRFELPVYPSLKNNYNKEFAGLDFGGNHYSTDQLPSANVSISPRIGLNWDITGERTYVLRGGTGLFVGRLPFVWLVSAVGNSNVGQTQYFYDKASLASGNQPNFHPNVSDIVDDLYGGKFEPQEMKAPAAPTIIDKNLKMPSTWKTSLAFDMKLPGSVDFTLEGIYNKDINPVVVSNYGYKPSTSTIELAPGDVRNAYTMYSDAQWSNKNQNVYMIENGKNSGYYYSISAQLRKNFNFGLDLSFAYTHSIAKSYSDGIGDQVTSAYKTNTYSVNGINEHELGYGTYVAPDRIIATIGYKKEYGKHFASSIGLLYEGMQMGSVGGYTYARYSYTFSGNVVGDYGANNLLFIPSSREALEEWQFKDIQADPANGVQGYSAKAQKDDFWAYINQDSYLKKCKGEYTERGGAIMPWHHQINLKFNQDFYVKVGKRRNTLQLGVDINNLGNLLNNNWGIYKQVNESNLLGYNAKTKEFTMNKKGEGLTGTYTNYQSFRSTYSVQFSLRYIFH